MGWFSNIVQLASSATGLGWLSTALSQIDASKLEKRIANLEDPISTIHRDVPELCKTIYESLNSKSVDPRHLYRVTLEPDQREKFDSVLKVLDAKEIISIPLDCRKNRPVSCEFTVTDPLFCLYVFELYGPKLKVQQLKEYLDNYQTNIWYDGKDLAMDFEVPIEVPDALFKLASARGLGLKSGTIGKSSFIFN